MDKPIQFVLASLVIFAFGLGLILLVHFTTKKRKYIRKNGIEVEGEIIDARAFYNLGANTLLGRKTTSYYISCKYITKNNEEIKKEYTNVSFRKKYLQKHPIGSKIKILYLHNSPYESIIKSSSFDFGLFFIQLLGFTLFGLSAFILYNGFFS